MNKGDLNNNANNDKKTILFVTAHPDDESMFFLPTILDLKYKFKINLLCLSNGDFDG
jgi:N-acetylglucosaminylphosphatidylinositol deacetylase